MKKRILAIVVTAMAALSAGAQSRDFKLGEWVEIHNAILKELSRSYVDTLPLQRMQLAGIDAMLDELDPYTIYVPEEENEDLQMMIAKAYGGIGAIIFKPEKDGYVTIDEPYAGSPGARAGLQAGDRITHIDWVSVKGLETKECSDRMKGKPGTKVTFRVIKVRSGEEKDITVTRERIHLPDIEYAGMLNDTTGYILQTGFTENVSSDFRAAFLKLKGQGMKRLVYDLRGNGGGLLSEAVNIVSIFVPKGSLVVTSKGASTAPVEMRTTLDPIDTRIPVIMLVDGGSASASEIVSGALQDMDRATVMGKRTYGKGLVQSIRPLPYNGQLKVTTAKYYTPSGRCVQAIDYARRAEDGSVVHIPDSLTREFKTLHGRTVRDGGGITPDVELEFPTYSRLIYSLVVNGIIKEYTLKYISEHESIAGAKDYHFTDYDDFVTFAMGKEFDYRSSAKTLFDQMKAELERDGVAGAMTEELEALDKAIEMDKEKFLRLKKDEIVPWIEEEIVTRYWYQEAGVEIRIRYDEPLHEALTKPLIEY
ncbi:MAG: S41 family peptidase [Bacteroidales bacterium]|nr:S41 family peptidase [Bacteroidales bacterium]